MSARRANRVRAQVNSKPSSNKRVRPRLGSTAKACTEVSTPERTTKVPSRLSEKVKMESSSTAWP
ncbi:hypothetical protein D3C76_1070770 [compost metagenome]